MKVLYFALECKPYSKVGGVGDVALELPLALKSQGVDIEIVTPYYSSIDSDLIDEKPYKIYNVNYKNKDGKPIDEKVKLYSSSYSGINVTLLQNATYFEGEYGNPYVFSKHTPFYDDFIRFCFFSFAAVEVIKVKKPDIVHVNDWGLGFLLGKLKLENVDVKKILTIHNNSYQGNMWIPAIRNWSAMEFIYNKDSRKDYTDPRKKWYSVNPLKLGIESADAINAVSPTYKKEILKKDRPFNFFSGGNGLEKSIRKKHLKGMLFGMLNGFEYKKNSLSYNQTLKLKSECKKKLSSNFKNPDNVLLGFVGRAVEQKFKLLREEFDGVSVLEHILKLDGVNISILATGLPEYEEFLKEFKDYDNVHITLAFDKELAQTISLGCDIFLMPSLYEPCGITQIESLSNATPPLVRFTGGLKDTVVSYKKSNGTGFGFNGLTRKRVLKALVNEVQEAINLFTSDPESFDRLRQNAFQKRFLWSDSAKKYVDMYKAVLVGK